MRLPSASDRAKGRCCRIREESISSVLVALVAISCNKDQPAEDEGNKEPAVVELSGITLSEHTLSLKKGESTRLEVTFTPANATDKTVTWESSATISPGAKRSPIMRRATLI